MPALNRTALALTLACGLTLAHADNDQEAAVPYRPSVSVPAALSAASRVEFEFGGLRANTDEGRRYSTPFTVKYAFNEDWGVRVGGEAWVRGTSDTGARQSSFGDTTVILKRRFAIDKEQAFGLEAGFTAKTARHGLGLGSNALLLTGIYSAELGDGWHTDVNLGLTRLSQSTAGVSGTTVGWAAALSRTVYDQWGAVVEVSGTRRSGADSTLTGLAAVTYSVTPGLVLDAGAARSLKSGLKYWQLFSGVTWLGPKMGW